MVMHAGAAATAFFDPTLSIHDLAGSRAVPAVSCRGVSAGGRRLRLGTLHVRAWWRQAWRIGVCLCRPCAARYELDTMCSQPHNLLAADAICWSPDDSCIRGLTWRISTTRARTSGAAGRRPCAA
jgi:hypothetical protein